MRYKTLALAGATLVLASHGLAQTTQLGAERSMQVQVMPLAEAWRLAEAANPTLRSRQAQLTAAEGVRTDASALLFNNPQLSYERTRRDVPQSGLPGDRQNEWRAGLSQTLEVAGQPRYRRDSADAALGALRAEIDDLRQQLRGEVGQQFYRVLALQQRVELEAQALELFERSAAAIQKRRAAGEDTKLDANVAAVEAERARNQLALAREQLLDARSEFGAKLQMPAEQLPAAAGDLADTVSAPPAPLQRLLDGLDARPKLRALAAREDSARARLGLERASRYPDLTVGINVGREGPGDARERVTMFSVSVPVPLFKRNAAGIGQASTELVQSEVERQAAMRDMRAHVRVLWAKVQSLQERVRRLQDSVLPTLQDNQELSLRSQRAGQIGALELIVVNRQALDARRDLLDALADYQSTRFALEALAGGSLRGTTP